MEFTPHYAILLSHLSSGSCHREVTQITEDVQLLHNAPRQLKNTRTLGESYLSDKKDLGKIKMPGRYHVTSKLS